MLSGFGISGRECSVSLELLSVGEGRGGIRWFYGEREQDNFNVLYENRTTVLEHCSGKRIIGVEHLSAAALMFQNCEFKLNAPQGELPLLDGSARLWVDSLRGALRGRSPAEGVAENVIAGEGETSPLEVEYSIDRFNRKFNSKVKIKTTADLEKILDARTFIFEEELASAKLSQNLIGCGILIGRENADFRFENEPAYHKILDLIGDLSVYENKLPAIKLNLCNAGHKRHHEILYSLYDFRHTSKTASEKLHP